MQIKEAVEAYQCPGCVCGSDTKCGEYSLDSNSCAKHVVGTGSQYHKFFLGLPTGFCNVGLDTNNLLSIFKTFEQGWGYTMFNLPVWKYLKDGHTFVRGLCPRVNYPFIHIFLEDCMDKIDCLEITDNDIEEMD